MSIERQKSLKINMMLNAVRSAMQVLFPLITFPYVSCVLGVENIGRYWRLFCPFSGLGINSYAIREGVALRENCKKLLYQSRNCKL